VNLCVILYQNPQKTLRARRWLLKAFRKSLIGYLTYLHMRHMPAQVDYGLWLREIQKSNLSYTALLAGAGEAYPPIFFFGNPDGATAATIGVNPSAGEFLSQRKWGHKYDTVHPLLERCRKYFHKPAGVPPHPWFQVWEEFLAEIGVSYRVSPRAIHLDFSPRATRSISSLQKESEDLIDLFSTLVAEDLKYLLKQLQAYPSIKHLYLAGAVTKKHYCIEFLMKNALSYNYQLKPVVPFRRGGRGQVGLYKLDLGDGISRHLFFCSTSPSARVKPHPLPHKAPWLKKHHTLFIPD
jgi:hypothetical protein